MSEDLMSYSLLQLHRHYSSIRRAVTTKYQIFYYFRDCRVYENEVRNAPLSGIWCVTLSLTHPTYFFYKNLAQPHIELAGGQIIDKIKMFPYLFFSNFGYYILSSLPANY
jgi:hypothetical protein